MKSSSVDLDSPENKHSGNETKVEKLHSPVTLHGKVNEKCENSRLLRQHAKKPESLESLKKFAKRMRSFLGRDRPVDQLGEEGVQSGLLDASSRERVSENEMNQNEDTVSGNAALMESPVKMGDRAVTNFKMDEKQPFENGLEIKNAELFDGKNSLLDEDTVCGIGWFRPQWIQRYSTPKVFLILFSSLAILQGAYYSYFVSVMTTLEKRYAFKTKISGAIMLTEEFTPLLLGVIIGYMGGRVHRPRLVALGMFMSAGCCFLSGLPYLIYGSAKHLSIIDYKNETGPEFCDADTKSEQCDTDDRPPTMAVIGIFLVAMLMKGFSTISFQIVGISYLDDNIKKKNSPMYLATTITMRLLGPLLGYLMSSVFLKFYETPSEDPGYGPDDPRWIGGWWMGFFLQAFILLIFTLPLMLFPRRLPGQPKMARPKTPSNEAGVKGILIGLLAALKRLGRNTFFVLFTFNTIMIIFGHFGHGIMLPKYMENQFRLSAAQASLYSGAISIFFVMLSTMVGGYIIWKFRPKLKTLIIGMIISEVILIAGYLILMIPQCQTVDMANFGMNDDGLILNSDCNKLCDCSTVSYAPFCGPNGTTYFSPCYAGCTQSIVSSASSNKKKEFGNCFCVSSTEDQNAVSTISEGVCTDEKCWPQAIAYLVIYFILLATSKLFIVVHSIMVLRSVHPNDKSIALGTHETLCCLFGFIPLPITYGALVDSACLVWESSCGGTGNCWFYDTQRFSYLLHGVGIIFCFFSLLSLIGMYYLSPTVRDLYADENGEEEAADAKPDAVSGSESKF